MSLSIQNWILRMGLRQRLAIFIDASVEAPGLLSNARKLVEQDYTANVESCYVDLCHTFAGAS